MARQRGLALVTVLLVMALLTLLVAGMLRSHQLLVAGVGQQLEANQLLQLASAGERILLRQLADEGRARPQQLLVADSRLELRVEDLGGRLNLGALIGREAIDPVLLERWQRLCASLQISAPAVDMLVGQTILDVSQLRQLPGLSLEAFERLRPWVAALPAKAGLNVNSAPARVLATLDGIGLATARQVVAERPPTGFASVQQFLATPALAGRVTQAQGLAVSSRWLRLEILADQPSRRLYLYSDVEIDSETGQVHVVRRRISAVREPQPDE
ncbi:type II secretion system protein GspK [Pseudomonas sichuanensis]|uniref:general secretion pathway protein GspK n=1 Tax=Pseudomonas sichuanensis TaxID=2213015 RepID=UPI0024487630|nr:type II secretion system protein GspK [Pseudomonas sichuanensis]MDH0730829.1 type II secretion system protein GspK [Pseudomonas sichuanensis]MDH1582046.1 type II secretion system protein GspK [Pseudomonas sichuanensis]MDH1594553.1 type II secretion system protein GspK [Pseudomonas sichuanensis]MDH1596581.1 type II secretion system protein GspK [Pseudomonas sichuanensis]